MRTNLNKVRYNLKFEHHYYDEDGVFYTRKEILERDYKVLNTECVAYGYGRYLKTHYIKLEPPQLKLF